MCNNTTMKPFSSLIESIVHKKEKEGCYHLFEEYLVDMSLTLSKLGANLSMNLATLSKKDMKLFETANKILDRYSNANVKIQTKQSKLKKLYELNMSLNEAYVDHRIRSTLASYFLNGTFASIPRSILTTAKQRNLYIFVPCFI